MEKSKYLFKSKAIPPEIRECLLLGALGYSGKLIQRNTKITPGRMNYQLRKWEIRLRDYRDGKTDLSQLVMERAHNLAQKAIEGKIRKMIKN